MAESTPIERKYAIPNDLLNDLSSRFIINVPEEERVDLIRLCFQIELAHWFYLDFYCEENLKLPKCSVKDFIRIIFGHIPFLKKYIPEVDTVIAEWKDYKSNVPTCGAILLDEELKNVLLVQSFYTKASWGFPKGKINIDEPQHLCAIREVREETGFEITDLIDKEQYLEHYFNEQAIRLYIITGIPLNTVFQPRTKNEIKSVEWFAVNQLPSGRKDPQSFPQDPVSKNSLGPNSFFMVIPFVKPLKKWIASKQQISKPSQEKKVVTEKQVSKQQQFFAQLTKSDYVKLTERKEEVQPNRSIKQNYSPPLRMSDYVKLTERKEDVKSSRAIKQNYSPPPRMVRQRKAGAEKKKNYSNQIEELIFVNSRYHKPFLEDVHVIKYDKVNEVSDNALMRRETFYSPTWKNFKLDCEAIVATFNINLRKTGTKY